MMSAGLIKGGATEPPLRRTSRNLRQVELALFLCRAALIVAPSTLAVSTFHRIFEPTVNLVFSMPVLGGEIVLVLAAFLSGFRPVQALLDLTQPSKVAVLIWLCVASYVTFAVAPDRVTAEQLLPVSILHGLTALALNDRLTSSWRGRSADLLVATGWGAVLYSITIYILLFSVRQQSSFDWIHIGGGATNPRHLGYFGLTAFGIGAGFTATVQRNAPLAETVRNFFFVAIGSGLCFWSGGRAAALAIFVAMAAASAMADRSTRVRTTALLFGATLLGAIASIAWVPAGEYGLYRILGSISFSAQNLDEFSSGRFTIWLDTIRFIGFHPWLGYGLGQFKFLVPSAHHYLAQPHNWLLQFLFQWGILGTAAVAVATRASFVGLLTSLLRDADRASSIATCLVIAQLTMATMDGNLHYIYPTFAVMIGLVVLAAQQSTVAQPSNA